MLVKSFNFKNEMMAEISTPAGKDQWNTTWHRAIDLFEEMNCARVEIDDGAGTVYVVTVKGEERKVETKRLTDSEQAAVLDQVQASRAQLDFMYDVIKRSGRPTIDDVNKVRMALKRAEQILAHDDSR